MRDLLFARLLQYRAYKHVAEMFAELEAAALRSYPRAVALEDRYASCCPRSCSASTPRRSPQIAATVFTPRPVPTVGTDHLHIPAVSVPEQAQPLLGMLEAARGRAVGDVLRAGRRLRGRRSRSSGGSWRCSNCIRARAVAFDQIRTAWCAPGFVDRRPADQRTPGSERWKSETHDRRHVHRDRHGTPRPRSMLDVPSRRPRGIDVDQLDAGDSTTTELGAVLEALLLVVDTPVPRDALAVAIEQPAYRVAAKLQLMADELHRARQRDRPARGRRRLADVHPGAVSRRSSSGCCSTARGPS